MTIYTENKPKIDFSVLMSVYKKENPDYLRISLDSIMEQTLKAKEIVIVEDGPLTKELSAIIRQYQRQFPNYINVVPLMKNVGLGKALNCGLEKCKNEIIARMDSDDISKPNRFERQITSFIDFPDLDIVGTWVDEFVGSPQNIISVRKVPETQSEIYDFGKRRSPFNHPTVMYKKSSVKNVGGYHNLRRNQDLDLFGRMLFAGCNAYNIPESLLFFRCNNNLLKRRKSWANTVSYIATINNFRKMGYSSSTDLLAVTAGQCFIFCCPPWLQDKLYKKFLRK